MNITGYPTWYAGGGAGSAYVGNNLKGIGLNGLGGGSASYGGGGMANGWGSPVERGGNGTVVLRFSNDTVVSDVEGYPSIAQVDGDFVYQFHNVGNASITFEFRSHDLDFAWSPCPNVEVPERIAYDSIDYDVYTGDLSLSGVDVGFFKLIRKIVIYAVKIETEKPMVVDKTIVKITPGTSKFPLKSALMNVGGANVIRVKLIGNRIAEGSKSTNGVRAHPIWECVERTISA